MSNQFPKLHADPFVTELANKTLGGFETVAVRQTELKSTLSTAQRKLLELFDTLNAERRFETLGLSHAAAPSSLSDLEK